MSRKIAYYDQPVPTSATLTSSSGRPLRVCDTLVTTAGVKYNLVSIINGSATWEIEPAGGVVAELAEIHEELNMKLNISDAPNYAVGQLTFYMDDTASGIEGYEILGTVPDTNAEEIDSAVCNNNTVLIAKYVTEVLGITTLKAGNYNYHMWRSVSNAAGISQLQFKYYSKATNGDETLLYTHELAEINDTSLTYAETIITEAVQKTILETDRLALYINAKTTHLSNVTVSFAHSGTLRNSHIETPIDAPVNSALRLLFDAKQDKALVNQDAPASQSYATILIQSALRLTAKAMGTAGNSITVIAVLGSGANVPLSCAAVGNAITITLGTGADSLKDDTKNTSTLIAAKIIATAEVFALVYPDAEVGATVIAVTNPATPVPLANGSNGTVGYFNQVKKDASGNIWRCLLGSEAGDINIWSPDGYPSNNAEYVARLSGANIIYKARVTGTTSNTTGTELTIATSQVITTTSLPCSNAYKLLSVIGLVEYSTAGSFANMLTQIDTYDGIRACAAKFQISSTFFKFLWRSTSGYGLNNRPYQAELTYSR